MRAQAKGLVYQEGHGMATKNIIICFDGTNNHPRDAKQEREWFGLGDIEDNGITNILKLHVLFGGNRAPICGGD